MCSAVLQDRFEFDEPDFAMIDTLFSLAEAHLFMQLVELQDTQPELLPPGKTRPDLYRCMSVHACMRQGHVNKAGDRACLAMRKTCAIAGDCPLSGCASLHARMNFCCGGWYAMHLCYSLSLEQGQDQPK